MGWEELQDDLSDISNIAGGLQRAETNRLLRGGKQNEIASKAYRNVGIVEEGWNCVGLNCVRIAGLNWNGNVVDTRRLRPRT
jgi:hypothetical protein